MTEPNYSLSFGTLAALSALRYVVEEALGVAEPLLTQAPDDRPATPSPVPDPTADTVLHPARMAVADAYHEVAVLARAIELVENAEGSLAALADAVDRWHGADPEEADVA